MSGSVHSMQSRYTGKGGIAPVRMTRARSRDRLRLLAEAIESEVLPRLLQDHDDAGGKPGAETPQNAHRRLQAWVDDVESQHAAKAATPRHDAALDLHFTAPPAAIALAALVLAEDEAAPRRAVADAVAAYGLETVCLDLLAPAARHLGELWNEDICSFSDVTIGLMRLQSALLAVTVPVAGIAGAASARRSVLLAPAPGDYHNFGLTMVAGFLERGGWSVTQLGDGAQATIEAALRRNWFGVLGLSAGSTAKLAAVQLMLPRLRAVSRNPDLGIMVGGPPCVADPGLARDIGADCTAADGQQAVKMAEALIAPRRTKPRVATG